MEADVHLDEDVHGASSALHRLGPSLRDGHVIDDERQPRLVEQFDYAFCVGWIERVGQPDVLDPGSGKDLRFTELGAADADRTAGDLSPGKLDALMGLGVRPEPQPPVAHRGLEAFEVALDARGVDEHARRAQLREFHPEILRRNDLEALTLSTVV